LENFPAPPSDLLEEEAFPEPPPDYDLDMESKTYEGLIPPHKLPNPVLDSKERIRLNKEIKFNAKRYENSTVTFHSESLS